METKICTTCNEELTIDNFYKVKGSKFGVTSVCKKCKNKKDKEYRAMRKLKDTVPINTGTKICSQCGKKLSVDDFYKQDCGKNGLQSVCKKCAINRTKKYYKENKKEANIYSRTYHKENIEQAKMYSKIYYKENAEKLKQYAKIYRKENSEKIKISVKRWYLVTGMRPYNFVAVFQSLRAGAGQKFDRHVDSFLHRIGLFVCCWQALVHDNWSCCCGLPDRVLYFDSQKIGEVFRLVLFLWMSLWSKH